MSWTDNQGDLTPGSGYTDLSFLSTSYSLNVAAGFAKCNSYGKFPPNFCYT